jgi:hypothetical protein
MDTNKIKLVVVIPSIAFAYKSTLYKKYSHRFLKNCFVFDVGLKTLSQNSDCLYSYTARALLGETNSNDSKVSLRVLKEGLALGCCSQQDSITCQIFSGQLTAGC